MAAIPPTVPAMGALPTQRPKTEEIIDYSNLPCPVRYEQIRQEAIAALKQETFEGMRFEFNKPLNPKFFLSHSVYMGSIELPSLSPEPIKVSTSNYEFGANYVDPKLMLIGRVTHDGRLNARLKWDLTDNIGLTIWALLSSEPHMSQGMGSIDFKGSDYRAHLKLRHGSFVKANYIQSVTSNLALGGDIFWEGEQKMSAIGSSARYSSGETVVTALASSTGIATLSYVQKVNRKVYLATEVSYNHLSKHVKTLVGYDAILRQARVRGKIDSNGCVAAYLEERFDMGLTCILSAEINHKKKDYKFGFGFIVGKQNFDF